VSITWRNHTGNQSCEVVEVRAPRTLEELVATVRDAEARGLTVRAVGAGHAWSDVALTDGIVIDPKHLGGVPDLDDGTLADRPADAAPLVRVLGGTHIHELNAELRARDLALTNMGGYDGQTIAGVVSTSTHGSGLAFGPFPDMVRSLDLVIAGGETVRVEPAGGITDPSRFDAVHRGDGWRLIQDDDRFQSAVCGMGTLGLVYALVLEVRTAFWLDEFRRVVAWEDIRDSVTARGELSRHEHYELFMNPYRNHRDRTHHTLVTTRQPCAEPPGGASPGRGLQHPLTELEASLPITGSVLRFMARTLPWLMTKRFDHVLDDMQDPSYRSISYTVFNIGEANHLPAYSMELGVTLEGDRHLEAIDRILVGAETWARKRVYHTSPIALRFVAPSKAYASMMFDQPTMMIELIMVAESRRGEDLLAAYERDLAPLGARAHWGQVNALTPERVRELYPRWDTWLETAAEFNATGVFASPFTRRVGIPGAPARSA
jgi:hypothetical protein